MKFLNFFFIYRQNKCIVVQYWKIERKEKLDWPWKVSVIWMHVAMSVSPRWWDLWGRNGPWGKEGRHHRSWLSGRWKGTPFSVRKSMQGRNQTARLSVFIQVKKKKMQQLKSYWPCSFFLRQSSWLYSIERYSHLVIFSYIYSYLLWLRD